MKIVDPLANTTRTTMPCSSRFDGLKLEGMKYGELTAKRKKAKAG